MEIIDFKPTLEQYHKLICADAGSCKDCGTIFDLGTMEHYEHDHGWPLAGFKKLQWIYITCRKCRYQWSLAKLRLPNLQKLINGKSISRGDDAICTYKKDSVEPCETCPRQITALHSCKLLQETVKSNN